MSPLESSDSPEFHSPMKSVGAWSSPFPIFLVPISRMCGPLPPLADMPSGRSAKATGTTVPLRYPHTKPAIKITYWHCYMPADYSECQKCEIESLAFLRIWVFCTVTLRSTPVVFFSFSFTRSHKRTNTQIYTHTNVFIVSYCVAMIGFKTLCWEKIFSVNLAYLTLEEVSG